MATRKVIRKKKPVKKGTLTKKQLGFLSSLKENLGIISKAAHECNLHRNTHYLWMKKEAYAKEFEAILEDCIDVVENSLMTNILQGDVTSIIFFLKTKARKRGYVEKPDVTINNSMLEPGQDKPKQQVIIINGQEITF